jgi:GH15 family glucan-1,4-alpha-glucosidase
VKATAVAIADELTKDGLVLRHQVEGTDTGFEGEEGTFTICSFWLVTALAMVGEIDRAHALCQKRLSFAGPLLLYAEEIDTATGQHLGNFPQAFIHPALIEAVSLLIALEQRDGVTSTTWQERVTRTARSHDHVWSCTTQRNPMWLVLLRTVWPCRAAGR